MVQLALTASEEPQLLVCPNSLAFAPTNPIEVIVRAAFPVLLSVTALAALVVPRSCGALKFRFTGATVANGPGGCPTPVSGTVCGLPAASSVMISVSFAVPGPGGVKVILMVQ